MYLANLRKVSEGHSLMHELLYRKRKRPLILDCYQSKRSLNSEVEQHHDPSDT